MSIPYVGKRETLISMKRLVFVLILLYWTTSLPVMGQKGHTIAIDDLNFTLDGQPFFYTGISFFNAIYNPAFNENEEVRKVWLEKFKSYGIHVIRIWAQWDNTRGFVDTCPDCTLYHTDGSLRQEHLQTLKNIIASADEAGVVVLFVFFQRESWNENIRLSDEASDQAVRSLTQTLQPYRNVVFQIWNEFDHRTIDYLNIIKSIDADRLVTNAPGYGGFLGNPEENEALDFLSPHTSRNDNRHWEIAPQEIAYLIEKYQKPVVDDEPARKGTPQFGGPRNPTSPFDHILHIYNVWKVGGHAIYHHDMFQTGYGSEAIPPSGIPDPEFSPYHQTVFDFLAKQDRYLQWLQQR